MQARHDDAIRHFEDAARIKPHWMSAQRKLGTALARQVLGDEARRQRPTALWLISEMERNAPLYRPVAEPVRLVSRVLRSSPGHRGAQKLMGAIEADRPPAEEG